VVEDADQTAEEPGDRPALRAALERLASQGLVVEHEGGRWRGTRAAAERGRAGRRAAPGAKKPALGRAATGEGGSRPPDRAAATAATGPKPPDRSATTGPEPPDRAAATGATGAVGPKAPDRQATGGAKPAARRPPGARSPLRPEAEAAALLQGRDSLVGTIEIDELGRPLLAPFDARLQLELPVEGAEGVARGELVVVAVVPASGRRPPRARLVERLGPPDEPGVDVLAILRHYRIPDEFPPEVERAAESLPAEPRPPDWQGREDLRGEVVITIDGETARDFDDAVSIERLGNGVFRLGVHIADVSHYVPEGSVIDREAYLRGTSVYYPERAVPMLPERLSNGLCSLRPHSSRLTVSAFLDFDRDGRVLERRFAETVIRSTRRMTYEEVRRLLSEPRPEDGPAYGDVLPALREMHHLMEILLHARMVRGSIDFDLPEGNVELDTDGVVVGIRPQERTVAHRIIEEFMIAANEAVAFELVSHEIPALFRVHDPPRSERLEELRDLLRPLGIELPDDLESLHPSALQAVLRRVAGTPEEQFVASVVLRTMQRAIYDPECRGHYALASRYYTHFTSPIRRYPDLLVHRQLKRRPTAEEAAGLAARLPEIAEHCSVTEKRAEQSERDLLQWKKVRFLAGRVGERFWGRITGVQPFGLFVQLEGLNVDGLVPVRTLGDDYYVYEPEAHRLVGERHGRVFQLADAVEVELTGADLRRRSLDLRIVGVPTPPARAAGRRPAGRAAGAPPPRRRAGAATARQAPAAGKPPSRPPRGGAGGRPPGRRGRRGERP
jgi:ribonuclease R